MSQCKSVLRAADKIWILSNGSDAGPGTTAAEFHDYLALHDLKATIETFPKSRKVGTELLKASKDLGADLMIMGAYSDSHEQETVFGGNTQTVVDTATLPILLNH
jgi:nucleotide-binding universal stress UspA family protein